VLTLPEFAMSCPDIILNKVLFPAPLLPSKATLSPSYTEKLTPFRTSLSLKDFFISSTLNIYPSTSKFLTILLYTQIYDCQQKKAALPLRARLNNFNMPYKYFFYPTHSA
jgi:hypothetical protein